MKNTIKNKIKKDDYFNKNQTKLSIKIIDMFNEQNTLQVSQRKLGKTLKVSRETVRRLILKLIKHNYLKILMQGRQGSGTKYELSFPELPSVKKTDNIEFDFDDFSFEDEISESSYTPAKQKDISKTATKSLMQQMEEIKIKKQQRDTKAKSELEAFIYSFKEPNKLKFNEPYIRSDISLPKADDLIPYTKPISKLNHNPFATSSLKDKKIEILKNENELLRKMINIQNKFMELKADMQIFETKLKELGEELKKHHS